MPELDKLYLRLLDVGFSVLRQAIDSEDPAWINAELEFLHNIPSLVGETKLGRHQYFWDQEQRHFQNQINRSANAFAKSRMQTYYIPILREMQHVIEPLIGKTQRDSDGLGSDQ